MPPLNFPNNMMQFALLLSAPLHGLDKNQPLGLRRVVAESQISYHPI